MHQINQRNPDKYEVINTNTNHLRNSTVPFIQQLLHEKIT